MPPFPGDPLAFYGKLIIEQHHAALRSKLPLFDTTDETQPDPYDTTDDKLCLLLNEKVGILGAGIGGLYTALILDSLCIKYEILEATARVGGRLKTHRFTSGGNNDYYEEGAMLFPFPKKTDGKYENGVMARLADLTEYGPLNEDSDPNPLKEQLIPFYNNVRGTKYAAFYYFNGVRHEGGKENPPNYEAEAMNVPPAYVNVNPGDIQKDALAPFIRILTNDLKDNTKDGWDVLMENDGYSVRGYLASKYLPSNSLRLPPKHLSSSTINWINLLRSSTGAFDHALTEAVFAKLAYGANDEWKCFKGGSETLSKKIADYLELRGSFLKFNQRVTAISRESTTVTIPADNWRKKIPADAKRKVVRSGEIEVVVDDDVLDNRKTFEYPCVAVTVDGEPEPRRYDHVISTIPLPVLRTIDLRNAGLDVMQSNALRVLEYGPALKIAIRFKSNWWFTKLNIFGGQAFTDLPISTIVYPSYGADKGEDSCKVLLVNTRTKDATRLGALAAETGWKTLKELVLRNLEEAHYGYNGNQEITYKFLRGDLADDDNFHVKDWSADINTMGGYANFMPGEFQDLYTSLNAPAADGCLHFAGEVISTRHGWLVGALDSAWRAVYEYLEVTGQDEKLKDLVDLWGANTEWTTRSKVAKGHNLIHEHIALLPKFALGHT